MPSGGVQALVDAFVVGAQQRPGGLQRHADREERLDDPVVEVAGDAVPLGLDGEGSQPLRQQRVLDRRPRLGGEDQQETLVAVVEAAALLGEVEVAVHGAARADRRAEERRHLGVVRRKAGGRGVGVEVVEADDARVADEQAEQSLAGRVVADRPDGLLVGAVGDEPTDRNARGGAPHIHLEVRPGGTAPVSPYPFAAAACF